MATWKHALSPQCPLDKQVAICQLVSAYLDFARCFLPIPIRIRANADAPFFLLAATADVLSDLLLIAAPLRLIRNMSAIDGTRRRLMIIFSTSIVTT